MSDRHVYTMSSALLAAYRAWQTESEKFLHEVVRPFDAAHPGNEAMWSRGLGLRFKCVGFADDNADAPPPEGLSRAQTRVELRPKKTKAGREWQSRIDAMNERPDLDKVFRKFDVPTFSMEAHRIYKLGVEEVGGTVFVVSGVAIDGEHLSPVNLSEYYAAKEAAEAAA